MDEPINVISALHDEPGVPRMASSFAQARLEGEPKQGNPTNRIESTTESSELENNEDMSMDFDNLPRDSSSRLSNNPGSGSALSLLKSVQNADENLDNAPGSR